VKVDLEKLENNEAVLLMYLSGELSDEDRDEVEQMLASDAGLRTELESLRSAIEFSDQSLSDLDAHHRPAVPEALALRQIMRLMEDWSENRRQPVLTYSNDRPRRTIPWRKISYAMAASMLVVVYVWAGYRTKPPVRILPADWQFAGSLAQREYYSEQPDEYAYVPPANLRPVSSDEKLDLLASSLNDSSSDETSNLRVAQIAAVIPSGADLDPLPEIDRPSKSQNVGEP
jgi:hypothetical protein